MFLFNFDRVNLLDMGNLLFVSVFLGAGRFSIALDCGL